MVLFELFAERLDHLAYAQERAVAEGFLDTAVLRRSVEDHARALDCLPDPGLSATTMLRFRLRDDKGAVVVSGKTFTVAADTLVANDSTNERSIVFATEEQLVVHPDLDAIELAGQALAGDTGARLRGELAALEKGRWLVFTVEGDPHHVGHVVRVTKIERAADVTEIHWDPRRPLPCDFAAPGAPPGTRVAVIYGNVVPAHHGIRLAELPRRAGDSAAESDPLLGPYRRLMQLQVNGEVQREVTLPLGPVSVLARGYPFPEEAPRPGVAALSVRVEGDHWDIVKELSTAGPCDEVVALRHGERDESSIRFGRGGNGASLPAREVSLDLDLRIGLGRAGNVGARRLTRLIRLGSGEPSDADVSAWNLGAAPGPARDVRLRALLDISNPLPAIEGRDPEPLDHLRYRAPIGMMDALSAVTPADYERLLGDLPEVAAVSARVLATGVRPRVRAVALLRDEDTLAEAERLRRWANVRRRLEQIRLLGFDAEITPPRWVPLDLDVVVDAAPHAAKGPLRDAIFAALAGDSGLLDPDVSGLGGDVHLSSLYQAVLAVPGVASVRVKRFRRLEPGAIERLGEGIIPIAPDEVAVLRAPARAGIDGLLTVTVCGGLQ
ncbi:MAG: hypothetical protein U0359_39695 [Byssovorax sp.]